MDRYIRNIELPGFGEAAQSRLSKTRIGIIGAGALGSVAAAYLAAAGVGILRIAEFDNIELSNLQRQVFFSEAQVGTPKGEALAASIRSLNSQVEVELFSTVVTGKNISEFIEGCDLILECSDNPFVKDMTVRVANGMRIPSVVGGVREYEGQIAVFTTYDILYTDIFPSPASAGMLPCSAGGVFGPVAGIVASLQAAEALKIAGRIGEDSPGINIGRPNSSAKGSYLLVFDVRTMQFSRFEI